MSKQKNQIVILLAVIIAGAVYAYVQYLFFPQWETLKADSAQLAERQAYLEKLEEHYRILPSLQEQAIDLRTQAALLEKEIPKKADKPDIMLTIYNMAKDNGLSPISLTYDPIRDQGDFSTMGMSFSCSGSPESVYILIDQFLNDNKYIFALESISLDPGESDGSVKMKIISYFYKQKA